MKLDFQRPTCHGGNNAVWRPIRVLVPPGHHLSTLADTRHPQASQSANLYNQASFPRRSPQRSTGGGAFHLNPSYEPLVRYWMGVMWAFPGQRNKHLKRDGNPHGPHRGIKCEKTNVSACRGSATGGCGPLGRCGSLAPWYLCTCRKNAGGTSRGLVPTYLACLHQWGLCVTARWRGPSAPSCFGKVENREVQLSIEGGAE